MTRLISLLNSALFFLLILILGYILYFSFFLPKKEPPLIIPKVKKSELPKNPFTQPAMAYQSIAEGPLNTSWKAPKMQLPDLREELVYFGKNGRPDVSDSEQLIHLTLQKSNDSKAFSAHQKIYLVYKKNGYCFSTGNQPSSLWIEVALKPHKDAIEVNVGMLDENKQLVKNPEQLAQFELSAKEYTKNATTHWELGGCRVDSTLLVRQKARWIGRDLFLEMHGGEEYLFAKDKERIDFMGELPYFCFVKQGDFLIWKNSRWQQVDQTNRTVGYPLIFVKSIDEKLMNLDLWDVEGRNKASIHMIRTKDTASAFPNIQDEFKFVGAKTWAQFVIETRGERMLIKPNDWLIFQNGTWKKISTAEEVDQYVNQRLQGPLFILDRLVKQNGKQQLVGHLFNTSRTEVSTIELPAHQNTLSPPPIALSTDAKKSFQKNSNLQGNHSLEDKAQKISRGMYQASLGEQYE